MKSLIVAGILAISGWVVWPYYAIYDFVSAMQKGDAIALDHRVAWDSVRQGLRDDFKALFAKKMSEDTSLNSDKPGAAFGAGLAALLGPAIIDRAVDAYVTPQGLANLIRAGRPAPATPAAVPANTGPAASNGEEASKFSLDRVKYAFFSQGPTTFRVEVSPPDKVNARQNVVLLFKWDGDWRLSRIFMPLDDFK